MKKTIFTLITVMAAAVTLNATAHGQTPVSELKCRIVEQAKTSADRQAVGAIKATSENDAVQSNGNYPTKNALAGTWDVVITTSDGFQVKSTLQIMPGAAPGEGSAIHASEFSLAPPSPTLPEQGSWRYFQGDQFITSYYGYSFDEQLQPFGKIGFRHIITLDGSQNYFTGRAVFEVIDLAGNLLFSDNVQTAGRRQRAAAP